MTGALTNTEILLFVLGYQGGTIHQVCEELGTTTNVIMDAAGDEMRRLCRIAQRCRMDREKAKAA